MRQIAWHAPSALKPYRTSVTLLGSIVGLVGRSGNTLAQHAYDPVSNTRAVTGNLAELTLNPYGYAAGVYMLIGGRHLDHVRLSPSGVWRTYPRIDRRLRHASFARLWTRRVQGSTSPLTQFCAMRWY